MPISLQTPPAIEITYVGGPTTVIEVAGIRFMTDPTFDVPGPYASGKIILNKTKGPSIPLEDLGRIDVVLLSHDQHPDNLDPAGRALVARVPALTTVAGARRLGRPSIGMEPWQWREFETPQGTRLKVTATPARHGPAGIEAIVGDVIGFVISSVEPAADLVYVTGDTVWYDGTADVARRFHPAAVLLFGGAARTRGPFHLTMDTNEAVELATAFPDAAIVPVHHEGWEHFTQSQDDLIKTFDVLGIGGRLRPVSPATKIVISPAARGRQ
ncbi:MAG TPA: MBL fold metallo-hydrolase [Thermoanaerobaculia bacterium]|nr:MBL fold metallo-hydrolase [Thermoanaerobaculia bacterium]